MNQAYLLLLYVTSDLFLLVSMVRSLKCCQQRRSALMVSNEVSTRVDLYSSCLRFSKWAGNEISQWAGIDPPMFHVSDGLSVFPVWMSRPCTGGRPPGHTINVPGIPRYPPRVIDK